MQPTHLPYATPRTDQHPRTGVRISVIGCGYLGAVHAAAMAELEHEVVGIDIDTAKIGTLQAGKPPFFEDQLPELLISGRESGRLSFSTDFAAAATATVHFIAVGTPQVAGSNAADLRYLDSAIDALTPYLKPGDLVVGKSTVPVGTAEALAGKLNPLGVAVAWNPEFLRESHAVNDTISPDRLVYGVASGDQKSVDTLNKVYEYALSEKTPLVVTDYATAELVKVAANAFLATKISFINAMSEIAEVAGADIIDLADAIGHDARIGRRFLNAGVGFGGGCLPKDIRAFAARADELGTGQSVAFLKEVDTINLRQRQRLISMVVDAVGGSVNGKRITVLGLAFKPNSDDVRDSPALDIAVQLKGLGAIVTATDPEAINNSLIRHPQLDYTHSTVEALTDADAVVLVTEWSQYKDMDPTAAGRLVNTKTIIDGRNALDSAKWRNAGWVYRGMGTR